MDGAVEATLSGVMTGLGTDALAILGDYLPIAGGIMVTVGVVFFGIKIFRAIAHV